MQAATSWLKKYSLKALKNACKTVAPSHSYPTQLWTSRMLKNIHYSEGSKHRNPLVMMSRVNNFIPWAHKGTCISHISLSHLIYPLTTRVVGAPQMILHPVSTDFLCPPLPSGTWRTPGQSIPWCCLPTSSSVCLVFFPLSLCLARWFWPDLINGRHDHTTADSISLRWSGLRVVQLPSGSWHGLPRW